MVMPIIVRASINRVSKVANPARKKLNWERYIYGVPVRAWELGLARRFGSPVPRQPAQAESGSVGNVETFDVGT